MSTIDDKLNNIKRHKGVFDPDKKTYMDWVFRYNCRLLEQFGYSPNKHSELLEAHMLARITETEKAVVNHYAEKNTLYKIYVPSVDSIDNLLEYDIQQRGTVL